MRYRLIPVLLVLFSVVVLGSCKREKPRVDLAGCANSGAITNIVSALHNGKEVELTMFNYYKFDAEKLTLRKVSTVYNENSRPWLLFCVVLDLRHDVANSLINLSEYREDGMWHHVATVKNLSDVSMIESTNAFTKDKYKLEFK